MPTTVRKNSVAHQVFSLLLSWAYFWEYRQDREDAADAKRIVMESWGLAATSWRTGRLIRGDRPLPLPPRMHFPSHINFWRLLLPYRSLIFVQSLFIPPASSYPTTVNQKMYCEFRKHGKRKGKSEVTSSYVRSNYFRKISKEMIYLANGRLKVWEKKYKMMSRAVYFLIRNSL
jgi:hypothetical protein